jgi:membrane protein DedA with SNARE-associated domain
MLNTVINHLLIFSGWSALLLVFLLPALESSVFLGFVIPGETAVVVGGFLAYEHRVSFPGVLAAAILGAIIGDSIGFWVGERWGDSLLGRLPKRFIRPEHVEQGKQSITRLGGRAVFAGRWVSVLRALVPGLCGTSGMRYATFLLWNAIGGITWAIAYTLLGYLAGSAWQRVEHYTSVVSYALLGAIVLAIVGVVLVKRRRQRARDEETREELAEETHGSDGRQGEQRGGEQAGTDARIERTERTGRDAQPAGRGAEPGSGSED